MWKTEGGSVYCSVRTSWFAHSCRSLTVLRHTRAELKEGQQRPLNRTYYYIDYRATIDAIKWRVYLIDKEVQGKTVPADERKEYFCTRCKSEWTVMEVIDRASAQGFMCHKCGFLLQHDPNNNRGGHEQSSKLSKQFEFITSLLPKIDQVVIPENTFEQALASQRKVIRDSTNPAYETAPVTAASEKPTAVKGLQNVGPTSISVTLTTSEGPTEADLAADKARKVKIAAQNAMPVHFTHSTISGEQVKFGANSSIVSESQVVSLEPDKKSLDTSLTGDGAEIDDYFARLKAEQAKEAEQEQDEEYETDDDEEENEDLGFEDVVPAATPSGNGTPVGVLKKSGSFSGSGTSTGVTSPVTGPATPNEDGRPAKKVRIEEPSPAAPVSVKVENEESDEDLEFEDV